MSSDKTFDFVLATELWEDEDFMEYCDEGKYMNCDTHKDWNGKRINDFPIRSEIRSKWLFKKRPFTESSPPAFATSQLLLGALVGLLGLIDARMASPVPREDTTIEAKGAKYSESRANGLASGSLNGTVFVFKGSKGDKSGSPKGSN
ncbi:hypothetical protein H2199_008660 [Coniosporium tulheliwenetii]|uniref:Uncharacterized protein n=1 Tax=Coniosporium tulheliwenetii TaxID=3383036 RepID=A0ACC2YJ01_9PEZI|nr:hypothetical protein H2199_008660 [Cladosporium sp. JES 115]